MSAARREYSEEVRTLASKVQSRDPRVLQHDLEVKREKVKKERERGREREEKRHRGRFGRGPDSARARASGQGSWWGE